MIQYSSFKHTKTQLYIFPTVGLRFFFFFFFFFFLFVCFCFLLNTGISLRKQLIYNDVVLSITAAL